MREISLHIMDIVQNSIAANASLVKIEINEDISGNQIIVTITDNGCGISEDVLPRITDPFITSRKSRSVGLGLSLFEATCNRCNGYFWVKSKVGAGTEVSAVMEYNSIDRPPMGKIEETISSAIFTSEIDILYIHKIRDKVFKFDTREIKEIVGGDLKSFEMFSWIKEYISENLQAIMDE